MEFYIKDKKYEIKNIKLRDMYMIQEKQWYDGKEAAVNIVSELSGCLKEDLRCLRPVQFTEIWNEVDSLFAVKDPKVKHEIIIKGIKYGLLNLSDITIGEIADAEMIMHDARADYRTHELLAILYRPIISTYRESYIIEPYDSYRCKQRAEDFLDFQLDDIRGATAFFFNFAETSIESTRIYLTSKMKELLQEMPTELIVAQEQLLKLLDPGVISSTSSQTMILSELTKQLNLLSDQHLTSWLEKETKPKNSRWSMKRLFKN